jgi:hypothetical protein
MMRDILDGYEKRTGVKPKRVVVHKTSMYQTEEEKGFRDAAKGIVPGCDLVWLRQTPFRLVRKGSEEPWRGTLCRIAGKSYLFTSGFVPWWEEFPGAHIPAPIQIGSLRQKAIKLGIKLGHRRQARKAPPKRGQSLYSSSPSSDLRV